MTINKELAQRIRDKAPGFYTENDDSPWYIVTPDHCDRIAADFPTREDAQRFLLWIAGDYQQPNKWMITPNGDGSRSFDIEWGDYRAVLWARPCDQHFPGWRERV